MSRLVPFDTFRRIVARRLYAIHGLAHRIVVWSEDPDIDDAMLDGIGRRSLAGMDAQFVEGTETVATA